MIERNAFLAVEILCALWTEPATSSQIRDALGETGEANKISVVLRRLQRQNLTYQVKRGHPGVPSVWAITADGSYKVERLMRLVAGDRA